jgi:hypothetical protein
MTVFWDYGPCNLVEIFLRFRGAYCLHVNDYVDWMRLCLWTATTNGPIVHPPGDIWAWKTMLDVVDWGKLPIRPPEGSLAILPAEPSSSKSGGSGQRVWWILSTEYFFHTHRVLLHALKSYNMEPPALLPLRRKVCLVGCGRLGPSFSLKTNWYCG